MPSRSRLTVNICSSSKGGANRAGWLDIDGQTASFAQVDGKNYDMATGLNPLNVQVAADGKLAIVNNIGGVQDGQVDTVGMIDLEAGAPRVIDKVVVGDGPEGLGMSPADGYVTSLILNGTAPKTAFYRHEKSYVALLKIEGKTVRNVAQAEVGGLARASPSARTGAIPIRGISSMAITTSCGSKATSS